MSPEVRRYVHARSICFVIFVLLFFYVKYFVNLRPDGPRDRWESQGIYDPAIKDVLEQVEKRRELERRMQ